MTRLTNNDAAGTMPRMRSAVLDHDKGGLLVTGGPGSGKTSLLAERYAHLVEQGADPERVVLFALNRRAARAGRLAILRRLARSVPSVNVFTAHAFAGVVVARRFADLGYAEPPETLTAPEQYAVVRELLANEAPDDWPVSAQILDVPGFARVLADFVLRAQERLLNEDEAIRLASGRAELEEAARFYARYVEVQSQAGRVDAGGRLAQAAAVLQRGLTDPDRFDHVLVDDYQEATYGTEAVIAAVASAATSVVIAADPNGRVLSFRGSSNEPLARASEVLGLTSVVALDPGDRIDAKALAVLDDPAAPAAAASVERVEARLFSHPGEEADAVAREILHRRVTEDVSWGEIAVIIRRHGEYSVALRSAFDRHGIPFVMTGGEAFSLARQPANAGIVDLLRYIAQPERRADLVERVLVSPVAGLDPRGVRRLRREARVAGVSLLERVEAGGPAPLRDAVAAIEPLIRASRPDEIFWEAWSRFPREETSTRELDALVALGDVIGRFSDRRPGSTIIDFLETIDAADFTPDPPVTSEDRYPDAVRVLTAHQAQGRSFDVVLVAGCVEGEFPAAPRAHSILDVEELIAPMAPSARMREQVAEERRLFRLAVSRAHRATVLFASRSSGGANPRTPSRFAARLGLSWTPADGAQDAASLRAIEAALRSTAVNEQNAPEERLAALDALRQSGTDPATWWGSAEWTHVNAPLYEEEIRTSYSRLSSLENCPLQYLYAVEMGLDPEQSFQMWLGSTVHDIIDRAQQGTIERTKDAVLAALDEAWDEKIFPNKAIEHRRFLDARAMLARWIDYEKAEVVHSEAEFAFPLDGAIVRGKIDAIFRMENGHLRVVDYKTGRYAPRNEDAEENLQLAAYYLAMQRDEELRGLGQTGFLQFAYIAVDRHGDGFARPGFHPKEGYGPAAEAKIKELVSLIRAERFAPSAEADCQWCSFRPICPMWPEGEDAAQ